MNAPAASNRVCFPPPPASGPGRVRLRFEGLIEAGARGQELLEQGEYRMILEVAILDIKPGLQQQFELAFARAQSIISSMPGYLSHQLQRCIEKDNRYALLVCWQTLEAHTEGFRGSPAYQEWKALLHHFYDPFPEVHHYRLVSANAL